MGRLLGQFDNSTVEGMHFVCKTIRVDGDIASETTRSYDRPTRTLSLYNRPTFGYRVWFLVHSYTRPCMFRPVSWCTFAHQVDVYYIRVPMIQRSPFFLLPPRSSGESFFTRLVLKLHTHV